MLSLEQLIQEGRAIMTACAQIQDLVGLADEFPLLERQTLATSLADRYHSWYAAAQEAVSVTDAAELVKLYSGSFFRSGIKDFFDNPLQTNPLHNEQTAALVSVWAHPYQQALRTPMLQQVTVLERLLHRTPAVLRVGADTIRLPRSLAGHQFALENFLGQHPFEKNVFLMMRYRDHNQHVAEIIRSAVEGAGLRLWVAADVRITDELNSNVIACLTCCKYGVALFDTPEEGQHINPNVAYELGMMHLLDRDCLVLKSREVSVQSDILAKLYKEYDPSRPGDIITMAKGWLTQVGARQP